MAGAAAAPSFVFQPHCDLQEIMRISVLIDVSIIKFGSGRGRQQMTRVVVIRLLSFVPLFLPDVIRIRYIN